MPNGKDGNSNTNLFAEPSDRGQFVFGDGSVRKLPAIQDGSSNTVQVGESNPDRQRSGDGSVRQPPYEQEGSSNTFQLGESDNSQQRQSPPEQPIFSDGSARDLGQTTTKSGDGTPNTNETDSITLESGSGMGKSSKGSQNDSSGTASDQGSASSRRSQSEITDGSSNTILLQESTPSSNSYQNSERNQGGTTNDTALSDSSSQRNSSGNKSIKEGSSNTSRIEPGKVSLGALLKEPAEQKSLILRRRQAIALLDSRSAKM